MSAPVTRGGDRLSAVALVVVALVQYLNAAISFWRGELVSGSICCALGAILLLMLVGASHDEKREPGEALRYGWRHHKSLIGIGLLPLAVGAWLAVVSPRTWERGLLLAFVGFLAVIALLFQRHRRREREAMERPEAF